MLPIFASNEFKMAWMDSSDQNEICIISTHRDGTQTVTYLYVTASMFWRKSQVEIDFGWDAGTVDAAGALAHPESCSSMRTIAVGVLE